MRCAWSVGSSSGGVNQSILTFTPVCLVNSAAAASAPCRPERKTGLVELFAIIAMVNVFPPPAAAVLAPLAALSELAPPLQAVDKNAAAERKRTIDDELRLMR